MKGKYFSLFAIGFVCITVCVVDAATLKSNLIDLEIQSNTGSKVSAKGAVKFTDVYLLPEKVGDSYSHVVAELYYVDDDGNKHPVAILDSNVQTHQEISILLPPLITMRFVLSGAKSVRLVGYEMPQDGYRSIPIEERFPYYAGNSVIETYITNRKWPQFEIRARAP